MKRSLFVFLLAALRFLAFAELLCAASKLSYLSMGLHPQASMPSSTSPGTCRTRRASAAMSSSHAAI
jgi:hypothetical protein